MEKVNRVESCFAVDKFYKMKSKEDEVVKKFIIDDLSKRVAEHLADILSSEAQPEPRWIPVTEKLPEDGAEVWVTTEMLSEVTRARWHKDSMLWCHPYHSDCLLVLRPIAWMEMTFPEPYKGGVDGERREDE